MTGTDKQCADPGCRRYIAAGSQRRIAVGWFFDRDGSVLCPDHLPDELAEFMAVPHGA